MRDVAGYCIAVITAQNFFARIFQNFRKWNTLKITMYTVHRHMHITFIVTRIHMHKHDMQSDISGTTINFLNLSIYCIAVLPQIMASLIQTPGLI